MTYEQYIDVEKQSAWNPGLEQEIPQRLRSQLSYFKYQEMSEAGMAAIASRSKMTGIAEPELVGIHHNRQIEHALLICVMAGVRLENNTDYIDSAHKFREVVSLIRDQYIDEDREEFANESFHIRKAVSTIIDAEFKKFRAQTVEGESAAAEDGGGSFWDSTGISKLWGGGDKKKDNLPQASVEQPDPEVILASWKARAQARDDSNMEQVIVDAEAPASQAITIDTTVVYQNLHRIYKKIEARFGTFPIGMFSELKDIVTDMAMNEILGERAIDFVTPFLEQAVEDGAIELLPRSEHPVILMGKGASAAGKSSMRPYQQGLVDSIDVAWDDFAFVSTDTWRKVLLDYEALGEDILYAGALTGDELVIIDRKLDKHLIRMAEEGRLPNLLLDRFRFDSFSSNEIPTVMDAITAFDEDLVHLLFVVTSPEEIVERAWKRGIEVGRFKTVSDLLHHIQEAHSGMGRLLENWTAREDQEVRFEFVSNDVQIGEQPRTIAYGDKQHMYVVDIEGMLNITRFGKVNLKAGMADDLFTDKSMSAADNTAFLEQCISYGKPQIAFVDAETEVIYAEVLDNKLVIYNRELYDRQVANEDVREALEAIFKPDCVMTAEDSIIRRVTDTELGAHLGKL